MSELKVLTEMLSQLGEGAQTAFIVWVLGNYALCYLTIAGVFLAAFFTALKIIRFVVPAVRFMEEVRVIMAFNYFTTPEKNKVLLILSEYFDREKKS